jgi:hypothetical protein
MLVYHQNSRETKIQQPNCLIKLCSKILILFLDLASKFPLYISKIGTIIELPQAYYHQEMSARRVLIPQCDLQHKEVTPSLFSTLISSLQAMALVSTVAQKHDLHVA